MAVALKPVVARQLSLAVPLAIARFMEVRKLERALADRKIVERAKERLMVQLGSRKTRHIDPSARPPWARGLRSSRWLAASSASSAGPARPAAPGPPFESSPDIWSAIRAGDDDLRHALVAPIRREADHGRAGRIARLVAEMNSLVERTLIEELYAASKAGLVWTSSVRGICCLRPGVPGLSRRPSRCAPGTASTSSPRPAPPASEHVALK
jgi:hypothetical protein